jgi:hypothetical protein
LTEETSFSAHTLTFDKSNPKRERGNTIDFWEQLVEYRKQKENVAPEENAKVRAIHLIVMWCVRIRM